MFESFEGFGGVSGMGAKPGIIVVDFIKGFTDPSCRLGSDYSSQLESTRQLLNEARKKHVPIIFTTVMYEPHFRDGGYFIEKIPALKELTVGSDWVRIDPRLERREESEPLIIKKFASAFFGTYLHSLLTKAQVDTLIVTGCTTSGCVRATVVDGLQHGYRVIVPEPCVGDRSQSAHRANLYDMNTKYADVVSLEEVIHYIQHLTDQNNKGGV